MRGAAYAQIPTSGAPRRADEPNEQLTTQCQAPADQMVTPPSTAEALSGFNKAQAVFMEALRGAAVSRRALRLPFPRGAVGVFVEDGNRITKDEAAWRELEGKFRWE